MLEGRPRGTKPEDEGPIFEKYAQELNALGITGISTRLPDYAVDAVQYMVNRNEWTLRFGERAQGDPSAAFPGGFGIQRWTRAR